MDTLTITCEGRINLAIPLSATRVRDFQPPWRTVYLYRCPQCHRDIRVRAGAFMGRRAVPGVGGIVCGLPV
jgi:hypothetical protein